MIYGIIAIMIPALASIYGICWVITDRCMYGPPPAPTPHSTIGSADAPLSSLRKSRCGGRMEPGHAPVQVYSYVWDLQVLNLVYKMLTSTCTCTHLPLRLTNPLRVRKLHFPLLGEAGARAGWYTAHILVQFDLVVVSIIYEYFFLMQIENYTEHWLLHVRVPTCPNAQPIPWECGCSTFLPWERPAPRQASTQPCSSSKYKFIYSLWIICIHKAWG